MGQNQGKVGEQQGTQEEKEPSPDPGGSEKEGNASKETCREVEDDAGLVRERLDVSPGTEPASPTLKLDTHSHKKGAPPIDWEWIQGGDGEREGGRERGEGEEGRTKIRGFQKLNNIRVTKRGTLSTEVTGSSKPERIAVEKRSNRMNLENLTNSDCQNNSHEWKVFHKDNIQDLPWDSSSRVENVHLQQSKSSANEEKSVTSEVTRSLKEQDGSGMTDNVAVPGIDAVTVTEDLHDDNFPFEMPIPKSEAPTRAVEKNNLDTLSAPLKKNLPGENPLWQYEPTVILKSCEPSMDEEDRGRLSLSTSSRDNLPLKWRSIKSECQENIIPSESGSSGLQEHAAIAEEIYGTEIPSLKMTLDLSDRLEVKTTEMLLPNRGDVCDFATTVESKIRDNFGKIKKHQASSSNIERSDTTEKSITNPDSSVMASLDLAIYKGPTMSGFEELLEEEKHFPMPDLERLKNNAERKPDISCGGGGVYKETKEFLQEDRDEFHPPPETANVQTEKIPEQFLAVVTGQSEMPSLPNMTKGIKGELDPHLPLYAARESKDTLVREREIRNQDTLLGKAIASESDWDKLPGNIMFSNQDRDKGRTMATEKILKARSTVTFGKDSDKSFGEMTSKRDRYNQSGDKNIISVPDIHQEASVSISNSKLTSVSDSTAGHEEGRLLLSHVESKTCAPLTEVSKPMESHKIKNITNETKLCIADPVKAFTGPAKDGYGSSVSQTPETDNATTPLDVQNSLQHNTVQTNLAPQSTGQSLASDTDDADQSTGTRNSQTPVSVQGGIPARDKAENPPKGKPVSDLIKETIQLHEKMKEWTKPAEAKTDVVLDSTQSVKVAQMKAAFDLPKKSPDKGLERKPSVRKGKTQFVVVFLFFILKNMPPKMEARWCSG